MLPTCLHLKDIAHKLHKNFNHLINYYILLVGHEKWAQWPEWVLIIALYVHTVLGMLWLLSQATMHLVHPKPDVLLRVHPPRGCLIQGPPGCGKTMLAHATAGTHGLPMLAMAGTELVSGVSGDSERRIRDLFEQVRHFVSNKCC